MSEKFLEKLAEAAGRRSFLKTLSQGSAALALGLLSIRGAEGSGLPVSCSPGLFTSGCCCLFVNPSTCTYGGCGCEWSWPCTQPGASGFRCGSKSYLCKECYALPKPAEGDCIGAAKCSKAQLTFVAPIC